jgi:hypothetical protein
VGRILLSLLALLMMLPVRAEAADYQYKLYFGLSKPNGGSVSAAEWQAYEAEFAAAFPGFNVAETNGFYLRDKEGSRIITLFMDDCREPALRAMVQTYVRRFGQDSVLVAKSALEKWELVTPDGVAAMDDACGVD